MEEEQEEGEYSLMAAEMGCVDGCVEDGDAGIYCWKSCVATGQHIIAHIHITSHHLAPHHIIAHNTTHHITSHHITSAHVTSPHLTSPQRAKILRLLLMHDTSL